MRTIRLGFFFLLLGLASAPMSACTQGTAQPGVPTTILSQKTGNGVNAPSIPPQEIFVTESGPTKILTFLQSDDGNVAPQREIDGSGSGVASYGGITVAPNGHLYVTDPIDDLVLAYPKSASGIVSPLVTISCAGFNGPSSLDFDRRDHLFVGNGGSAPFSISILAADASGCVTGNASIIGGHTGLFNPQGLIASPNGRTFVLNNSDSITEYPPGASGNAGWSHKIHGPDTKLQTNSECNTAIFVDGHGIVYVANAGGNSITEYRQSDDGDAIPMRDIVGPLTGLDMPRAVTVNSLGEVFVVNSGNDTITVYPSGADGNAAPVRTIAGPKTHLTGFAAGIARNP
jgi:hypothetical protein